MTAPTARAALEAEVRRIVDERCALAAQPCEFCEREAAALMALADAAITVPDPDGQQRYIDQLHDLLRDMLTAYPGLAVELPRFQDRAGELYVHDTDGQPFSGTAGETSNEGKS